MEHKTKTLRAEFKAVEGAPAGTFEAIVAVFNNVDHGGDRIIPGAFTATLAAWAESGDPIPVIWSHRWDDPNAHIGYVIEAKETEQGLYVKAQMDVEDAFAAKVSRLLVSRRVKEFSFGYFPTKYQMVEEADYPYPICELLEIDLFEVGPTLLGMNPDTELIRAASRLAADGKPDPAPAVESEGKTDELAGDDLSRDTTPTIDQEQVIRLLTRTRYSEELENA